MEALVRPGRKAPVGERIEFADGVEAEVIARAEHGERTIRFTLAATSTKRLIASATFRFRRISGGPTRRPTAIGIRLSLPSTRVSGSANGRASFHAGDSSAMPRCRSRDGQRNPARRVGDVSAIREEIVEQNKLHSERFAIDAESARKIDAARRVVAVGRPACEPLKPDARAARPKYSFIRDMSSVEPARC